MQITTIGLDLAKHWFQVHGVDADGHVHDPNVLLPYANKRLFRRRLRTRCQAFLNASSLSPSTKPPFWQ